MLLVIALISVLACSVFLCSIIELKWRPAILTGVGLLSYGQLVLIGEVAGTLRLLNSRWFFLACHAVLLILVVIVWYRLGGRPLLAPFRNARFFEKGDIVWLLRQWPDLCLLACGVALIYSVGAGLVLIVPPNTGDSMGTFMARVGQWLTRGTFHPWQTENWSQIAYPINPQLQVLWTVLFWGSDQLSGAVQWIAAIAGIFSIYGLARSFNASRSQAAFAALVWATLPQILLQSTSTQTDLVASSLFLSSLYLLYLGLKEESRGALLLSALALALAAGSKQTVLFVLPGLFLALLVIWLWDSRSLRKLLLIWGGASLILFLLVGAYTYILNFVSWGNLFGPPETGIATLGGESPHSYWERLRVPIIMGARYLYQFFDVTGLPDVLAAPLHRFKAQIASVVFDAIRLPVHSNIAVTTYAKDWGFDLYWRPMVHEHNAWYGPLSAILLLPSLLYQCYASFRKRDPYRMGLVLIFLSLAFCLGFLRIWGGTEGRYFMIGVTACWALTATMFRQGLWCTFFRSFIVLVALVVMAWTTLANQLKPLIGPDAIWLTDRRGRQMRYFEVQAPMIRAIDSLVPPTATIGYVNFEVMEYLLFGAELRRRVVPLYPRDRIHDGDWLRREGVDVIVYCSPTLANPHIPDFENVTESIGYGGCDCALLIRTGPRGSQSLLPAFRDAILRISEIPADAPLLGIDPSLNGRVGISPGIRIPDWGLEKTRNRRSFVWLGFGEKQGLHAILWSDSARYVTMEALVAAGPARRDTRRTVRFGLTNESGIQQENRVFDSVGTLAVPISLSAGRNNLDVEILDPPTTHTSGDMRPILVQLSSLKVIPFNGAQAGPKERPLVTVSPELSKDTVLDPMLFTPGWDIETDKEHSWLWLGGGSKQGFGVTLHASREREIAFEFKAAPGPAREDQTRTLEFSLTNDSGAMHKTKRIDEQRFFQGNPEQRRKHPQTAGA